jgi:glycosyltransferase involved in cell wall biosynthesis
MNDQHDIPVSHNGNGKLHLNGHAETNSTPPAQSTASPSDPLVSILIPSYNRGNWIGDAVRSALRQQPPEFEVIVVDDGSTDQTLEVLKQFTDPRLRVIECKHIGAPAARNRAVAEARGQFILWLDSDDELLARALQSHLQNLQINPDIDVSYGDLFMASTTMEVKKVERYEDWYGRSDQLVARIFMGNCIPNGGTLIRKSLIDQTGGYDITFNWAHDYEFWSRVVGTAKVKHCGATIYKYRRHAENTSAEKARQYEVLNARVLKGMLKRYSLDRIFPLSGRSGLTPDAARAMASLGAAERLIGLKDFSGALEWIELAHSLSPSAQTTNLLLTVRKLAGVETAPTTKREKFRVVALLAAYNEGDVISSVIGDLIANGVEAYLIDNHSTDNTIDESRKWLGKGLIGIETFPKEVVPGEGVYMWEAILKRKEELAREIDADWFIHADADEFRESPWQGLTLGEGIEKADRLGFNAIGFELFNFRPTDESFQPGSDPRAALTHFERPSMFDLDQMKAWKKGPERVSLAATGGHEVMFQGRKVCPVPFILRHYPIRSSAHGRTKIHADRLPRFTEKERQKGWHVQYDKFAQDDVKFLHDPDQLQAWDGIAIRGELFGRLTDHLLQLGSLRNDPLEKIDSDRLVEWLRVRGKLPGNPPIQKIKYADQELTSLFYLLMERQVEADPPDHPDIWPLMEGLAEIKSSISSVTGASKAAAIWARVGEITADYRKRFEGGEERESVKQVRGRVEAALR